MMFPWIVFALLATIINADVELLECQPPDYPRWGRYGPLQGYYLPGDFIHYYCNTNKFIGGNFYRKCEDTGDWSGDTPVCDSPSTFASQTQSSTEEGGFAEKAVDGDRTTCSSTEGGQREEWYGNFTSPGTLFRVMIFLPKGPASYEAVLVKRNGEEVICGSQTANIDRYDWTFHNCPEPHNTGAIGLKIRSLTASPLQICEIAAYVLSSPTCTDPRLQIDNGRLELDRKRGKLVCENGFTRSLDDSVQCVRDGVWNRKLLFCAGPEK